MQSENLSKCVCVMKFKTKKEVKKLTWSWKGDKRRECGEIIRGQFWGQEGYQQEQECRNGGG